MIFKYTRIQGRELSYVTQYPKGIFAMCWRMIYDGVMSEQDAELFYSGLKLIAEKYQVPTETLFFVGDEEKDGKPAENAGCQFIRIDRKEQKDGYIYSLYELLTELN